MGLGDAMLNDGKDEPFRVLDLDALRKAFETYVQEHKTTAAEWGEHAERFLEKQRVRQRESS